MNEKKFLIDEYLDKTLGVKIASKSTTEAEGIKQYQFDKFIQFEGLNVNINLDIYEGVDGVGKTTLVNSLKTDFKVSNKTGILRYIKDHIESHLSNMMYIQCVTCAKIRDFISTDLNLEKLIWAILSDLLNFTSTNFVTNVQNKAISQLDKNIKFNVTSDRSVISSLIYNHGYIFDRLLDAKDEDIKIIHSIFRIAFSVALSMYKDIYMLKYESELTKESLTEYFNFYDIPDLAVTRHAGKKVRYIKEDMWRLVENFISMLYSTLDGKLDTKLFLAAYYIAIQNFIQSYDILNFDFVIHYKYILLNLKDNIEYAELKLKEEFKTKEEQTKYMTLLKRLDRRYRANNFVGM